MFSWDFILKFLSITLINIVLSGDNVIVIGMAAASLPRKQRKVALAIGGVLAIVLRIVLTAAAALLMRIPYLSAVGGLMLVWVDYGLLKIDEDEDKKAKTGENFRQAIVLILMADLMMSLDNVIAVAATAKDDLLLMVAGLVVSMPLLMTTGGFISMLIDKARWLVYVGAFAIAYTAVHMIFEDKAIEAQIHATRPIAIGASLLCGILIPAGFMLLHRQKRNRGLTASGSPQP